MAYEETTVVPGKKAILAGVLLLLLCAASWGLLFWGQQSRAAGYEALKSSANEKFEKQIYDEALADYKSCLDTSPNDLECVERVAEIYYLTGEENSCIAWCERVLRQTPENLKIRLIEARVYDGKEDVPKAIAVLEKAGQKDGTKEERAERKAYLRELNGRYELTYLTLQNVFPWNAMPDGTPVATVSEDGRLSLYTAAGKQEFSGDWNYLGAPADDDLLFPVLEQNEWFFVDGNGERRLVPGGSYTFLRHFSGGLAPAARRSGQEPNSSIVAGYLDKALQEQRFEFQETYPLVDGYALAKKNDTYFVLDSSLQEVTACEFTEVKTDPYGNAQKYGVILGKLPGDLNQWAIYAPSGIRVNTFFAEDFKMPEETNGSLAFRMGELWGFVSLDGSVVLEPQFEDALSFSEGMAAVKKDGKWGYIDRSGNFLIEPMFEEAGALSKTGSAFVKNHAGYSLMTLSRYGSAAVK